MSLPSLKNVSLDYNKLDGLVPSIGKGVKATFDYNSFCQPYDSRVTILLDIASDFGYPLNLVFDWSGDDPCQDQGQYYRSFIVCSKRKVITVNLANQNLTRIISLAFANLRNLYLNDNNLVGPILGSSSLTNLSHLWVLDVSNNNISSDVPKFSSKVKFTTSSNVLLGCSKWWWQLWNYSLNNKKYCNDPF